MLERAELRKAMRALDRLMNFQAEEITSKSMPKFKVGTDSSSGRTQSHEGESVVLVAMASVSTGGFRANEIFLSFPPIDTFSKDNLANILKNKSSPTRLDNLKENNPLLKDLVSIGVSLRTNQNLVVRGTSINFIFEVKEEAVILAIPERINALLAAKVAPASTTPFAEEVLSPSAMSESTKKRKFEHTIS